MRGAHTCRAAAAVWSFGSQRSACAALELVPLAGRHGRGHFALPLHGALVPCYWGTLLRLRPTGALCCCGAVSMVVAQTEGPLQCSCRLVAASSGGALLLRVQLSHHTCLVPWCQAAHGRSLSGGSETTKYECAVSNCLLLSCAYSGTMI